MKFRLLNFLLFLALLNGRIFAQSDSFQTYVNPVIPGDHPDPTLTKIGDYFYTSGSSFNPTPKIYRSSDLVHWEVIAQPVKPTWSVYGNSPGGGIWGGHMVYFNDSYWHYFGRGGGSMYFVKAEKPEGPWSDPVKVNVPNGLSGLGVDNSIFIDEDTDKWYMLTKHGRENNDIIELGADGQPTGEILDLTWLNPAPDYPYSWAEGPVMWKYNGFYYYSFAQHLAGSQFVMKSDTLSDDPDDWTIKPDPMQYGTSGEFRTPNHISPVVMLDDSSSWAIGHSYRSQWVTQGRQGILLQITYDEDGFPEFQYPSRDASPAPDLPSGGVSWMVPKSDMFTSSDPDPEWSFLGNASGRSHSLTDKPGWLHLEPSSRGNHTIIKNDGEHYYSIITRVEFDPDDAFDQAGLYIINGPQDLTAKVVSTADGNGDPIFLFQFDRRDHDVANEIGNIVWLKLVRDEHDISAYYSLHGDDWIKIGREIDASELNVEQTDFNSFTGNQQGLFVQGKGAYFDLYIYRDAYSDIKAQNPVNYKGVSQGSSTLDDIADGGWAMYAGVEFGIEVQPEDEGFDYQRTPETISLTAASTGSGIIEIWIDSLDSGTKISEIELTDTGDLSTFEEFTAEVDSISGQHDLFLRFLGGDEIMEIQSFKFTPKRVPLSVSNEFEYPDDLVEQFKLDQNYPNPFNPNTVIRYSLNVNTEVSLKVYDALGREVAELDRGLRQAGSYTASFNASGLGSGVYFYTLKSDNYTQTRKMILLK